MSHDTVHLEGEDAERLLEDAIRRAGTDGDGSLEALVTAFEAEGQKCFRRAESASTGLVKSLVLQSRGEAWLQAATRLRDAIPHTEARTALPVDDRPTAA